MRKASSSRTTGTQNSGAAYPETLVASELFGLDRNYPTMGTPERIGLIGKAENGTLFIDEVGEVPKEIPRSCYARSTKAVATKPAGLGDPPARCNMQPTGCIYSQAGLLNMQPGGCI
jgi:hypothetical protein